MEIYLNNKIDAEYFYKKASNNNFALSEFNLGRLYEKKGNLNEAIELYIRASDHENDPLIFHNRISDDEILNLTKSFIICLNDLKLIQYFLLNDSLDPNYIKSKKYFIKVFAKIQTSTLENPYHLNIDVNGNKVDVYSYIRKSFSDLEFISENVIKEDEIDKTFNSKRMQCFQNFQGNIINDEKNYYKDIENKTEKNCNIIQKVNKEDPYIFFDLIIKNKLNLNDFLLKIQQIIETMENTLYSPPYSILFGIIHINEKETK